MIVPPPNPLQQLPPVGGTVWNDTTDYGLTWNSPYSPIRNITSSGFVQIPSIYVSPDHTVKIYVNKIQLSGIKYFYREDPSNIKVITRHFSTDVWLEYWVDKIQPELTD